MSLKNVMTKKGDLIVIDSDKEKDRQTKYLHRSGVAFEGSDVILESKTEEEIKEEINMETAREMHKEKFGRYPSSKTKLETILDKINA